MARAPGGGAQWAPSARHGAGRSWRRHGGRGEPLHATYAAWGVLALLLALLSRSIREWPISEPLAALAAGVLLGPVALDVVRLEDSLRDALLLEGSRLLLAGSVMAAALRFQVRELRPLLRVLALLILLAMPLAAVITGVAALFLGLPLAWRLCWVRA